MNASDSLDGPHEGTMDDLYNHLEMEGLQYISLVQKLDDNNQGQLFNKTKIGKCMVDSSPISDETKAATAIQLTNKEREK